MLIFKKVSHEEREITMWKIDVITTLKDVLIKK